MTAIDNTTIDSLIETKTCRYGLISYFKNDSVIGSSLREYGEWAQNEINFLLHLIQPGDIVFDVGAFIGTHTLAFAQKIGQTGCVYAFEPNPLSYEVLQLNKTQNLLTNVKCEQIGLSNKEAILHLNPATWDKNNPGATTLIDADEIPEGTNNDSDSIIVKCLNNFPVARCRLVKIDAEGMERKVLEGGVNFLKSYRPFVYAECLSVENGANLISFMNKEEYKSYIHSVLAFSPANYNNSSIDIFGPATEVNIIFVPLDMEQNFKDALGNYQGLTPYCTLDDLVLTMINKPQYKEEVLVKTNAARVQGVNYYYSGGENMNMGFQANVTEKRIQELASQNTHQEERIQELASQNTHQEERIQELASQNTLQEERIQELTSQNTLQEERIQELTSQNTHQEERIQELASQNTHQEERIQELASQNSLQEERIQVLASQNTLQEERIQVLASQNTLQEERIQELASQNSLQEDRIQEQDMQIDKTINKHRFELEQIHLNHKDDLLKKNQAMQTLLSRLACKDDEVRTIEFLKSQLESQKKEAEDRFSQQLESQKKEADRFSQQLWEIKHSRSWKVVEQYWKLRIWLLPPDSFLIRILRVIKISLKVLFRNGLLAFIKYLHAKIAIKTKRIENDQTLNKNKENISLDFSNHPSPIYIPSQKIVPQELNSIEKITPPIELNDPNMLWERLKNCIKYRDILISISHDDYLSIDFGGIQMFMADEQKRLDKLAVSYVHLYPINQDDYLNNTSSLVVGINVDSIHIGQYLLSDIANLLSTLVDNHYRCLSVNLHQFKGWTLNGLKSIISNAHSLHLIYYIHDYFSVCPQYNLLRNNREFCNAPKLESHACNICVFGEKRKIHLPLVKELFLSFPFLVIAPSKSAKVLWVKAFPEFAREVQIEPHMTVKESTTFTPTRPNGPIKIAYAGQPELSKGWELWRELVDKYSSNDNYKLFHFGRRDKVNREDFENVRVSSKNRTAMVDTLCNNKIDVLFHCPIWPETFSFVLYEAIRAGCFILTINQSGNVADYVKENKNGVVFESFDDLLKYLNDPENLQNDLVAFQNLYPRSKIIELNDTIPCFIKNLGIEA